MTSNPSQLALQRQAIAKLVADGVIKHERPGQYLDDTMNDDEKARVPQYEVAEIQQAFPDILQIDFEEILEVGTGESKGFNAMLLDGRGDPQEVFVGKDLPPTTHDLVEVIRAYFKGLYNIDELEKGREVFEGIE